MLPGVEADAGNSVVGPVRQQPQTSTAMREAARRPELAGGDALSKPGSQGCLIEVATCQSKNGRRDLLLGGIDAVAVQAQEEVHGLECDALVSVEERMITRDAKAVCCSKGREVGIRLVSKLIARALQGRLEEPVVTQADSAPVGLDLVGVDCEKVDGR